MQSCIGPVNNCGQTFRASIQTQKKIIRDRLGPEIDPEAFWQNVKTNLQAGRIRLLFVADQIPSELKRIVEFLNTQMNPAEVLALELQQFEGQGLKTIVPVRYGQTEEARVIKGPRKNVRFATLAVVRLTDKGKTNPKKPENKNWAWYQMMMDTILKNGGAATVQQIVDSDRSMPMMDEVATTSRGG